MSEANGGNKTSFPTWVVRLLAGAFLAASIAWASGTAREQNAQNERITRIEEQNRALLETVKGVQADTQYLVRQAREGADR